MAFSGYGGKDFVRVKDSNGRKYKCYAADVDNINDIKENDLTNCELQPTARN